MSLKSLNFLNTRILHMQQAILIPRCYFQLLSTNKFNCQFSSVQFNHSVMSDSLRPHESQHARPPCPSPTPGVHSNSCALSRWCHPAISSSVLPFASCPQSFPESGSFWMSQLFAWGGQSIGVSASTSVLPMNTQDWSPLGWTGRISLQSMDSQESLERLLEECPPAFLLFFYYSPIAIIVMRRLSDWALFI